jgi:hypothetical protein
LRARFSARDGIPAYLITVTSPSRRRPAQILALGGVVRDPVDATTHLLDGVAHQVMGLRCWSGGIVVLARFGRW